MIITIKIDEDNDIYEITVNEETYSVDGVEYPDVYKSKYSKLFDELNFAIEAI